MSPVFGHGALRLYLLNLLEESPRHGYDLMKALEDRFLGLYTPSAGTIYPRLARMEASGLVEHDTDDGGRKTYRLTDAGRAELRERADDLAEVEQQVTGSARAIAREVRDDVRASVRDLRDELRQATKEVRREDRRGRQAAPASDRRAFRDLRREVEAFAGDVLAAAASGGVDPEQVNAVAAVLRTARADVRAALSGAR